MEPFHYKLFRSVNPADRNKKKAEKNDTDNNAGLVFVSKKRVQHKRKQPVNREKIHNMLWKKALK